jgi:phage FluMu protein Com
VSKKKYIVRCPHCNHRVFDADYADVEIKCPVCRKIFELGLDTASKLLEARQIKELSTLTFVARKKNVIF